MFYLFKASLLVFKDCCEWMFTNQGRTSAVTICPKWDQRQFSIVVCNNISLYGNIAHGALSMHCEIHWEKFPNITIVCFVRLLRGLDLHGPGS